MTFFEKIASLFPTEYLVTFGMCLLGSLSVAIVMRFVVKTSLVKLDAYIKEKHPSDKVSAIYQTVKAIGYAVLAGILTIIAVYKLMAICPFPAEGNKALTIFYVIPMYALQWFLDAHMKKLACRIFGLEYDGGDEADKPEKEKEARSPKVHTKKVKYYIDEDGNEVPLEQ